MTNDAGDSRRTAVPFDPYHFERLAGAGRVYSPEQAFDLIYESNHWAAEKRSGAGASINQTLTLLEALPVLLEELDVHVLLDLPTGEYSWMSNLQCDGVSYIGGDIVSAVVARNRRLFGGPRRTFVKLDLTRDPLPPADLLLCRDCFVHLSYADIQTALRNILRAPIKYLLTTTFPRCQCNEDIVTGDWRVLNLQLPPFSFPPPERLIAERCTEGDGRFDDKSLGLWRVSELGSFV